MNMSDLSSLLILIGVVILVYPITVIVLQFDSPTWLAWFFKVTIGVGSGLLGAGIGLGVGHLVYRKKDGEKNE